MNGPPAGHRLMRTTIIPAEPRTVFRFFASPWNLEAITPPWLRFKITDATDDPVREGTRIRYRLALRGVPIRWESRITEYEPDRLFADEQIRGPYARWYHRHHFRPVSGGVEMTDEVDYRLPAGPLGVLAHRWFVRRDLEAIFDYRGAAIAGRRWE